MEIVPGVHMVPGVRWSRVYLIEGETLALVDSGPPWSAPTIAAYIRSLGRSPSEVSHVLMTHSHFDHSGGARSLAMRTGALVVAHSDDTMAVSSGEAHLSYLGVLGRVRAPIPMLRGTPVGRTVEDGEVLTVGSGVRVIHTPGHTPGSVCYHLERAGVLFTGDTVFSGGRAVSLSAPYPKSSRSDLKQSLSRLAALDFDVLCGGHGTPLVGGASDRLNELLATQPEPPTWTGLLKRLLDFDP